MPLYMASEAVYEDIAGHFQSLGGKKDGQKEENGYGEYI